MYLGTQCAPRNDTDLQVLQQLGVEHVCFAPPGAWREWTADTLAQWREKHARSGMVCEMFHLPLGSAQASDNGAPHVFMGPSADRDREIDQLCELIRRAALAGYRGLNYNITILGHLRTGDRLGRGGAILSSFEYDDLDQSLPAFPGGPVDADTEWERIDYWLARAVPVAEEYRIQLACHPQDPGIGDRTYRGVSRVLGTVEGFKRFVAMHESPYHGLNFCQGTFSEMLENPAVEIYEVIRYFGERKKIFNVHFRNIRGGFLDFVEVFPDEGVVDMFRAMQGYRDVGYEYMIMPDHAPGIAGDNPGMVSFAFEYGYLKAMLQAVGQDR
jgi:mannonate dehydratase